MSVSISQVTLEHHYHGIGIGEASPRISWRFDGDATNWVQTSYDVEVSRGGGSDQTHSVTSSSNTYNAWPEDPLASTEQAKIRVRANGSSANSTLSTPWSDWVALETGLLTTDDWKGAAPIAADRDTESGAPKRPIYFRRGFNLGDPSEVADARLYITALGLYYAQINGKPVGDYVMAPGWQSYHFRQVYDTFDITDMLKEGDNALGVVAGEGWYSGRIGFAGRETWGDTIGMIGLMTVTYKNGTVWDIPTDDTWKATTGPIMTSEIYDGEYYDSTLEAAMSGWNDGGFDDTQWLGTKKLDPIAGALMAPDGPPLRRIEEVQLQSVSTSPGGNTILDFGQNMVGWLHLSVSGPSGTNITLKHAEVLDGGELALGPLRSAKATDTLILHGNGVQEWEPSFTYHGFRYAQVIGWPDDTPLDADHIKGIVVHSDMEHTGTFTCSHDLLTKFHENVHWSTKGNFFSVSTDCPQRDERLGWTGDADAIGPTANFIWNTAGFWRGWHRDMWNEMQAASMHVPHFVPTTPQGTNDSPTAVWGDVSITGPWNLYQAFGDTDMLAEQWNQSYAWIETGIQKDSSGLWDPTAYQFGDWLDPLAPPDNAGAATTHPALVADAYLIRMTDIMANMSAALGDNDTSSAYQQRRADLTAAFQKLWMDSNGAMANQTQTAYALGLDFGIYTDATQYSAAADTLKSIVKNNNYLVGTGFAGTPALGPALQQIGSPEYMYAMLLQTQVPSWLYQVVMNGTTTWERWDSMLADGTINSNGMTSFNHYAFGAVSDWIHKTVGGLAPGEPGWGIVNVTPIPGGGITSADTSYLSNYGLNRVKWDVDSDGTMNMEVWVPPGAKAVVSLPGGGNTKKVGSGHWTFSQPNVGSPTPSDTKSKDGSKKKSS